MPPFLFSGVRLFLAGLVLLAFLLATGRRVRLSGSDFAWTWLVALCLFLGGNGLVTFAQKTVPSGITSVLVATTPLWMALLEAAWPKGERLSVYGWLGLLVGLAGVVLLMADKLNPSAGTDGASYLLVIASAFVWAFGAFLQRRRRVAASLLTTAAWQLVLGGASLALMGHWTGETAILTVERFTPGAIFAFCYLLVVGSLIGFVAFTWLIGHVSTALAGSYAYVNPVVALIVGWSLGGETLTATVVGGMVVILIGVALVRTGSRRAQSPAVVAANNVRSCEKGLPAPHGRFTVMERSGVRRTG
jgi:drug/metabolite transporter (DMT)-like permease